LLVLALSAITRGEPPKGSGTSEAKPNILVILADDLGWKDLACTGHSLHRTPNLDRLARQGMIFTEAHAAAPICSASRAALLTGRSPARLGYEFVPKFAAGRQQGPWPLITPDYPTELPTSTTTVASLLGKSGYTTAFAGKWHLNRHQGHYLGWRTGRGPESFGFQETFDDFGAHPYSYGKRPPPPVRGKSFPPDSLTDKVVNFLSRDHPKPFLMWLSFYHVHDPFHSRCVDRVAWHQSKLPEGTSPKRAHYAAMVETLDHEVGRVLDALETSGRAGNTVVIFTSDNGGHPEVSTNGPLRGSKWNLYQGGLRVPLIVRWPGRVSAGSRCGDTVIGTDLPATLMEVAGMGHAPATDGQSLLAKVQPVAAGRPDPERDLRKRRTWLEPRKKSAPHSMIACSAGFLPAGPACHGPSTERRANSWRAGRPRAGRCRRAFPPSRVALPGRD
ncbi:MAG: hypothetical protein EOP85_21180, partial [Verrucomicrobiaceae bacterium]